MALENRKRTWQMILHHLYLILLYSLLHEYHHHHVVVVQAKPLVPCMFVLGDSIFDNGNNNYRLTTAQGNYPPYGVDFPTGATGRFTNNRTQADIVSDLLGFDSFIPPYATTFGPEIINGVNFASAGGGIRDDTGLLLGQVIPLNEQISNFKKIIPRITTVIGNEKSANEHINECIYLISIGIDDFLNNYFRSITGTSKLYTVDQFTDALVQQFTGQLWTLYGYGARKVVIYGQGQGGCAPIGRASLSNDSSRCPKGYDIPIKKYNDRLKKLVQTINQDSDAKFIYVNAKDIFSEILENPSASGFKVTYLACCGAGRNNAETLCPRFQTPCPNRTEFMFWDSFHPTEAANVYVTNRVFNAQKPTDSYPYDISHLAHL